MSTNALSTRKGLTLFEMLIAIAIIGILAAMLFPFLSGYGHGHGLARRNIC